MRSISLTLLLLTFGCRTSDKIDDGEVIDTDTDTTGVPDDDADG
ncbi:MAG: hypothetical protein ACI8RZ_005778, partial [Myxococcota bacterium]